MTILFLIHLSATMIMLGVIWVMQVVHYPLFKLVGNSEFPEYERNHMSLITLIVAPVMIAELVTGIVLLFGGYFSGHLFIIFSISIALLLIIWLSTALLQAPKHKMLASGFNEGVANGLVKTNWIRTAAWTLRALLLLYLAYEKATGI